MELKDLTVREDIFDEHAAMVLGLGKTGDSIIEKLTPTNAHLWHMATGVAGEAGELLDAIKKVAIYNKPVDIENVIEELGDIEFYLQGIRERLNISRAFTLEANMRKLAKRYADYKYTDQAAQVRADKQEPQ